MQAIIDRAKELLANGTVARVLGWRAGDLPYNPEPAYFETEDSLKDFVYNGFCGANLSKYMIEASKMEEAFEVWEDEEMSNEELTYYLEVTNRITEKLLDDA